MTSKNVILKISVNIAATKGKVEGSSEYQIIIPENHLRYLNPNSFSREIAEAIRQATITYEVRNGKLGGMKWQAAINYEVLDGAK